MIYAYIRVSTDKQSTDNQRFEILEYARRENISIDRWVQETASGVKKIEDRKLGVILRHMKCSDTLIVSELSRLGRNLMQIMGILNFCMEHEIRIIAIKENYELGDNINSKVLAFAFGLSAEIERNLISQRTKEALARRKAEGMPLGRPRGSVYFKLKSKEANIRNLLQNGLSKSEIAKRLGVSRVTLNKFINTHELSQ